MVMIVSIDADIDEAQYVTQEHREQRRQRREIVTVRDLQFEHHDGNDDRKHTIAECFESGFAYAVLPVKTAYATKDSSTVVGACRFGAWFDAPGCGRVAQAPVITEVCLDKVRVSRLRLQ